MKSLLCLLLLLCVSACPLLADGYGAVTTIGSGVDTVYVLYAGGTPYDIGWWHGTLLRAQVQHNVSAMLATARADWGQSALLAAWDALSPYVPQEFTDELQGLSDGSGVPLSDLQEVHAIPDLSEFHCSAFAAFGPATASGHMLQARILDTHMDMGSQDNPLVIVGEPTNGMKYVNISFAGFVGSLAGIGVRGIGICEMGDSFDYANETLSGMPFPFLLRNVICHATSLADATAMMQMAARTSSLWYVVADALNDNARIFMTSPTIFSYWGPGEAPAGIPTLPSVVYGGHYMDRLYADLASYWGTLTPESAIWISRHNAMPGNLMDAVYDLDTGEIWVAYAEGETLPASGQTFSYLATREPPATFEDDFADPAFTAANWWLSMPRVEVSDVAGNGVLDLRAGLWQDAGGFADGGRSYFVDGLRVGADICVTSDLAGIAFGYGGSFASRHRLATYCVGLATDPEAGTVVVVSELEENQERALAQASLPEIPQGTWCRLELVSTLTNFEVWLAPLDSPLVKVIDVAQDALHPGTQAYGAGAVGFWADHNGGAARFDNVSIAGIPEDRHCLAAPRGVRLLPGTPAGAAVWLNDGTGVAGVQFELHYDPTVFAGEAPILHKGSLIAGDPDWSLSSYLAAPGDLHVMAYNSAYGTLPAGSRGELLLISLPVSGSATFLAESVLDLQGAVVSDREGVELPSGTWDGNAFVASRAARLAFDPVTSPQHGDTTHPLPFTITVRALDEFGDPATEFAGTLALSDTTGTISPAALPMAAGVATGSVTIWAAAPTDQITASLTDPPLAADSAPFQVIGTGDATGDGTVNVLDVVRTVNIALGNMTVDPPYFAAADANGDAAVNVLDVVRTVNLSLGLAGPQAQGNALPAAVRKAGKKALAVPMVADTAGLAGFSANLRYDAARLVPVEVRSVLGGDWVAASNLEGNLLRVLCYSASARPAPAGVVAEVVFAVKGNAALGALGLEDCVLSDRTGTALLGTLRLGKPHPTR